jgi:hypothetical protein
MPCWALRAAFYLRRPLRRELHVEAQALQPPRAACRQTTGKVNGAGHHPTILVDFTERLSWGHAKCITRAISRPSGERRGQESADAAIE